MFDAILDASVSFVVDKCVREKKYYLWLERQSFLYMIALVAFVALLRHHVRTDGLCT